DHFVMAITSAKFVFRHAPARPRGGGHDRSVGFHPCRCCARLTRAYHRTILLFVQVMNGTVRQFISQAARLGFLRSDDYRGGTTFALRSLGARMPLPRRSHAWRVGALAQCRALGDFALVRSWRMTTAR